MHGSLHLPDGTEMPMLYHYHIPLPIDGYRRTQESIGESSTFQSDWIQEDEMTMMRRSVALDELIQLEKIIRQMGSVDVKKIIEYIQSKLNELENE